MSLRVLLLSLALAALATACSEEMSLPPLEEEPPKFEFSQYLEGGKLKPGADVLLVRRPKHLEHVYALSIGKKDNPEQKQAKKLFGEIEGQFKGAGYYVAKQVVSLRCAAVELPDCVPKWSFIEELLGPGDGPGAQSLRQALAGSFEQTARQHGMESTLVLATVNVLLTRGMLKSALSNAAARAPAPAVSISAPKPLAPSPGLVQALTGNNLTPQVVPGSRLPQDVAVSPRVPKELRTTRSVGSSPSQNAQLQADIEYLENLGAENIRVNQQQLTADNLQRVGINRPDLQFDYGGRRYDGVNTLPLEHPSFQSR